MRKKYQIIYADPPWDFGNWSSIKDEKLAKKCGRMLYPTMTTEEICALPVNEIADKKCVLFLWCPMSNLGKAFKVIKVWGFIYKTVGFTWVKLNPVSKTYYSGLGNWTLGNPELCLLATHKDFPKRKKPVKQLVVAPRGKHSAKPPEVRRRIVGLLGDLPRIELFARKEEMLFQPNDWKGWDVWGNEVESDIELTKKLKEVKNESNC